MLQLEHLNTRVSMKTMARIKYACDERADMEGAKVPPGRIINELVMKYLPPTEAEIASQPEKKPLRPIAGGRRTRIAKPSAA